MKAGRRFFLASQNPDPGNDRETDGGLLMESVRPSRILTMLVSASIALAFGTSNSECLAQTRAKSNEGQTAALVAKIDEKVVGEFKKAWRVAGAGVMDVEGVVLLYRKPDGAITARSQGQTNQFRRFTITWNPEVIAIVHTHPNSCNAWPEGRDLEIADHLGIPVFTITNRGMYVYDPGAKKISKVQDGLDWLDAAKWHHGRMPATEAGLGPKSNHMRLAQIRRIENLQKSLKNSMLHADVTSL